MTKLTFVAKVIKVGSSKGIIIPKTIVSLLEEKRRYQFSIDGSVNDIIGELE